MKNDSLCTTRGQCEREKYIPDTPYGTPPPLVDRFAYRAVERPHEQLGPPSRSLHYYLGCMALQIRQSGICSPRWSRGTPLPYAQRKWAKQTSPALNLRELVHNGLIFLGLIICRPKSFGLYVGRQFCVLGSLRTT